LLLDGLDSFFQSLLYGVSFAHIQGRLTLFWICIQRWVDWTHDVSWSSNQWIPSSILKILRSFLAVGSSGKWKGVSLLILWSICVMNGLLSLFDVIAPYEQFFWLLGFIFFVVVQTIKTAYVVLLVILEVFSIIFYFFFSLKQLSRSWG